MVAWRLTQPSIYSISTTIAPRFYVVWYFFAVDNKCSAVHGYSPSIWPFIFSTVRNATVNSNRYNDEMSSSTSTPSQQLIALLQTVKTKIANGLSSDERTKIAKGIEQMAKVPDTLMGAIAVGRLCPDAVEPRVLVSACEQHNPLLLDELFNFPGVNTTGLQRAIVESSSLPQAMGRVLQWYPSGSDMPDVLQRVLAQKTYRKVVAEATGGPDHRQELSQETGQVLTAALDKIGTLLVDRDSVFMLLRASHYVLRGMARQIELHHQLPDDFPDHALQAAWRFHRLQPDSQVATNMAAFTLATKDLYPEALHGLTVSFPEASQLLQTVWNGDASAVREFLTELGGKGKTIVSRNFDNEGAGLTNSMP